MYLFYAGRQGGTIGEELTFGWPQRPEDMFRRQQMTLRLGKVKLDVCGAILQSLEVISV